MFGISPFVKLCVYQSIAVYSRAAARPETHNSLRRFYARWSHRKPMKDFTQSSVSEMSAKQKLELERQAVIQTDISDDQSKRVRPEQFVQVENCLVNRGSRTSTLNTKERDHTHTQHSEPDDSHEELFEIDLSHYESSELNIGTRKSNRSTSNQRKHEDDLKQKVKETKSPKHMEDTQHMAMEKLAESAAKLGVPVFTKLNESDPKLSNVMLSVKSKKQRDRMGNILLEGRRLIQDCIVAGVLPHTVFFSRVSDLRFLQLPDSGIQLYKVPYKCLELWSDVSTSQGIIAICQMPPVHKNKPGRDALPLTIICDNIRDPGNLGTILRTAAGVGPIKVILTSGCVDLWDPKVLRSGAGAHFRVPIHHGVSWEQIVEDHIDENSLVFLADNNSESSHAESQDTKTPPVPVIPYYSANYINNSIVLVIGGETEGLSNEAYQLALKRTGVRVNVPLSNRVDSLNTGVALGIISFEMKKQFNVKPALVPREELSQQLSVTCA